MERDRRSFLGVAVAGTLVLSGCTGGDEATDGSTDSSEESTATVRLTSSPP